VFSGIVETTGRVLKVQNTGGQRILTIRKPRGWKLEVGESVCVEGVCSTVQQKNGRAIRASYMPETLRKTTLGSLQAYDRVNLERGLTLNSRIGGHLVQGHVDATAHIRSVKDEGEAKIYEFVVPHQFSRYIVEKGSIAVDGISLTVVSARPRRFTVSLLAHTLSRTTLGNKGPGDRVNIEVDILAKYVEKLLS
jgi:riboflavin synthase